MIEGYYLGEKVQVLEILENGWCRTFWPSIKKKNKRNEFIQWLDQIKTEPFGTDSVTVET